MDLGRGAPVTGADAAVLWTPPADIWERSQIGRFLRAQGFDDYDAAWRWSVEDLEGFWAAVWDWFDVRSHTPYERVLAEGDRSMPGARWFPGATLNYAEHALRAPGEVVSRSQTRPPVTLVPDELRDQVARARAGLQRLGVGRGDRVAAYLPNIAETLVAFLATASLGAVWSSCAPEFGTRSVVDRLRQIDPKVLLAVDGYRYGDKDVDRRNEVAAIRAELPSLEATVAVPYLGNGGIPDAVSWSDLVAAPGELAFDAVPFDHPLYILFSSGTTGLPKPIVHGHGGILVEHLKVLGLCSDIGPADRFFWFSTTGWMMWNYLVSGLLVGAGVVLYDGNPGWPDVSELWRLAAETGVTWFGASAPFLLSCRKEGLRPGAELDLSAVRAVGSTGAPLPVEGFHWVYEAVGKDLVLSSCSGGTDVCSAFVGAVPVLPVRAGEITCRYLGAKVEAYDETGRSLVGQQGELVVTAPMPSMPVGFWGDSDGSRYRAAYFADFPGVWRHGDWITISDHGSCVISGRSDATLNRGGVRLGTAEFYSVVESLPEVADSLVVHLEDPEGGPGDLILFVALTDGRTLDDALTKRIATELRTNLSPRHVPNRIHQVAAIPRTLSGKKLEVPVKRILTGTPPDEAAARGALANPDSLDIFTTFAPTA
ncbi:MAG TPA: acetoacetate--CoA ligase [Acidimicrobiales bacterium]|nr:acetoacetate--CoA ligase [Acidimicrobiales bacterium]